jgi:hypothetical protein
VPDLISQLVKCKYDVRRARPLEHAARAGFSFDMPTDSNGGQQGGGRLASHVLHVVERCEAIVSPERNLFEVISQQGVHQFSGHCGLLEC